VAPDGDVTGLTAATDGDVAIVLGCTTTFLTVGCVMTG
jgi:hypothetical protein